MVTRETLQAGLSAVGVPKERATAAARPLLRFCALLAERAIPLGLLGPREADRLVERHILESAALYPLLAPDSRWIDVGTGAGLPGVVLGCLMDGEGVLLESEHKRCAYLEGILTELHLDEVTVVSMRAEDAGRGPLREWADYALARALAPPPVALELLLPLVRVGGHAIVSAGPSVPGQLGAVTDAATELGGRPPELVRLEVPGLDAARWAMIVRKAERTPQRYPRRAGVPARRPLGRGSA